MNANAGADGIRRFEALPRHRATIDGRSLSWVEAGDGPPVLLVHGSPTYSLLWRRQIEDLRAGRRVIAPDLLGFGHSDAPEAGADFGDLANALDALVAHLGLTAFDLVLHDWGGPVGVAACMRRGRTIGRLVLVNTTILPDFRPPPGWEAFTAPGSGEAMIVDGNAWCVGLPTAMKAAEHDPELHQAYLARSERVGMRRTVLRLERLERFAEALAEPSARLVANPPPTHIVWGADDLYFQEEHERLRAALPTAAFVEIPGGGHFPQEDAPAETTAAISAGLATRHPSSRGLSDVIPPRPTGRLGTVG